MASTRVLIVDDIAQIRHELRTLFDLSGRIQVIGEAADGAEAVRLAAQLRPDVVLMDLEMPVLDGYAATRQIKRDCPCCRVIALSIHEEARAREQAQEAGVDTFVPKGGALTDLLDAILAGTIPDRAFRAGNGEEL